MAYYGHAAVADLRNFASASFASAYDRKLMSRQPSREMPQAPFRYDPAVVPKRAYLTGKRETVPDFLFIEGYLAMSDRARQLIERFEPGLHQFVPVELLSRLPGRILRTYDRRTLETPVFLFAPQTNIDPIWVERSSHLKIADIKDRPPMIGVAVWDLDKVVLRKSVVDGHHIWIGLNHVHLFLMFSDSIVAAIKEAKLQKLNFTYVREE